MLSKTLLVLVIGVTIYRFYKHRQAFSKLSNLDWLRYIGGFIFSLAIGSAVIIGGIELIKPHVTGWLFYLTEMVLILIGLAFFSFIFSKFIPEQLKQFYNM